MHLYMLRLGLFLTYYTNTDLRARTHVLPSNLQKVVYNASVQPGTYLPSFPNQLGLFHCL